jgi:hypothetical protein
MKKYVEVFKSFVILILIGISANLFLRVQKANNSKIKELQKMRKRSEEVVQKKEREIQNLRISIEEERNLVDQAIKTINQITIKKQDAETLYVNKVQEINSFDANELKNYFNEELK